ncbi:GspH/FimT family pseudopilin [Caldimonas tepidiphila]|uniref:GspH/FimT family pseudopilin n=1 Tax=Caldimonas tepidiphila TaxID=2315841 RepID=UPI000E5A4244|nr:GspH/FimT family pseudopilin [Caldimonas tepidiphila]
MVSNSLHQGLSLIEALITIAILAVLSLGAALAWGDWIQRHRLAGVSAELLADLQYVRSEAVSRNTNLRLTFLPTPGGSCYLIHSGVASDCSCNGDGAISCTAPAAVIKGVFRPVGSGVSVESSSNSMLYSARLGTVTPASTIRVSNSSGLTVRHVVNIMGRVRTCAENTSVLGHPVCSS